jgi:hypothetical protein
VDGAATPGSAENTATPGGLSLLMNLHSALAENLLPNPSGRGRGFLQHHAVDVGKVYRPLINAPADRPWMLGAMLSKLNAIADRSRQSFFCRVHLPYLQPFADINKRTLYNNLPLFQTSLCRSRFWAYEQAHSQRHARRVRLTRIELLRDVYMWTTGAQPGIPGHQVNLAEPDPTGSPLRPHQTNHPRRGATPRRPDLSAQAMAQAPRPTATTCKPWSCRSCVVCMKGVGTLYGAAVRDWRWRRRAVVNDLGARLY